MKKIISIICASLLILTSFYYLIAEFVCINNSVSNFSAYYKNTISDLCVPFNLTGFSSSYWIMVSAFLVLGPSVFICYNLLFMKHLKRCKLLCFIFSFLLTIGLIMVGTFNCENQVKLHFIGASLTFSSCNVLVLLTVLNSNIFVNKLKTILTFVAIFGIISSILTISFKQTAVFPIFERLTVYPVIAFSIFSGFLFLIKFLKTKPFNATTQNVTA